MKKAKVTSKSAPKNPEAKEAIGGQPENDQDAREAGLRSATSASGGGKADGETTPLSKPPAKVK